MTGRFVIDTNVLVHAYDADRARRGRAIEVLRHAARNDGAIPAQVLAELASVCVRKLGLDVSRIDRRVRELESSFTILPLTSFVVREALRGVATHGFAHYDAQVWAAARLGQFDTVLSGHVQTGAEIEGVRFVDPFDLALDVAAL
jgi:predicted nucleic acid-binding protein